MSAARLAAADVMASGPAADADVEIVVVLQLNMPDQTAGALALHKDLTVRAIDALHALGARVRVHDVAAEAEPDTEAIAAADGILILGGGDVDARIYGHAEPVPNEYGRDRRADDRELEIIARGIGEDAIMLALCRGSQLLNVACGGSLIPDLDSFELHKGAPGQALFVDEAVRLAPGSIVHGLYRRPELTVRNGHHQAVDRVGEGLVAVAHALDGIVEAVERRENTWILGVQWHPEEAEADEAERTVLFSAFVDQVRAKKSLVEAGSVG